MAYNSFLNIDISPQLPVIEKEDLVSSSRPDRRNLAVAEVWTTKMEEVVWGDYRVEKAVQEGYKKSSWVYRCVKIKADAFASVNYFVANKDGERIENHPIESLLNYPNPEMPAQDMKQLLSMWANLAGIGYLWRVKVGTRTTELWAISPDRLKAKVSSDAKRSIEGYVLPENPDTIIYPPEQVIPYKFIDPANPVVGVSPLQACSKAVDQDVALQEYNAKAAQNDGRVNGVFMVDREYSTLDDLEPVSSAVNKKLKDGQKYLVFGNNMKYQQLSMTPKEMDFNVTREKNKEEIAITFGVPLPLISNEASTYNNFYVASLILYTMTIIPEVDDFASAMNHAFRDELGEGNKIVPDFSKIPAIRQATLEQVDTGSKLYDMGVPFENINRLFELGVNEFDGWDESNPKNKVVSTGAEMDERSIDKKKKLYTLVETRETADQKADKLENYIKKNYVSKIGFLLERQKRRTMQAIERGYQNQFGFEKIIEKDSELWEKTLRKIYFDSGQKFGQDIVVEKRQIEDDLQAALEDYLQAENWILTDLSLISEDTVKIIMDKVRENIETGDPIATLQQAILDSGIFSDERALRIARTTAGTASSIGQIESAKLSGATHKKWLASNAETREQHKNRDGETVPIHSRYSRQYSGMPPRYPLDHQANVSDRVNCRCSQSFLVKD
jgi:HK97 family phage portal protein